MEKLSELGYALPALLRSHALNKAMPAATSARHRPMSAAVIAPQPQVTFSRTAAAQHTALGVRVPSPGTADASRLFKPIKSERPSGISILRRVLLISIFHSTAAAFLTQGLEPTRLRPLELLRSGFDDVVHRIKQSEYHAVWIDVADARQFAGQERTSQVCSRLSVLMSWAERQSVPVLLAASRRTSWKHVAFQQLVDRGQFFISHHSWCPV